MDEFDSALRYTATGLHEAIISRNQTRRDLEAFLGVSGGYLTRVIQHERTCSESNAVNLSEILRTSMDVLFVLDEPSRELFDAWERGERLEIRGPNSRFWSKVKIGAVEECWEWAASPDKKGYGQYMLNGRPHRAHRVAYELAFGELDDDIYVLHACDNPPCCNPNHLFTGTHFDNMRDFAEKGLHKRTITRAKLTPDEVLEIRQIYEEWDEEVSKYGLDTRLGERYGVGPQTIHNIVIRRTWAQI